MADVKQKQNRVVGLGFAVDVELGLVEIVGCVGIVT
jgi:hypothetical protein